MADRVRQQSGSIGYVELAYAVKSGLTQAEVLNPAGKFVKATSATITAACQQVEQPRWEKLTASLTSAPGEGSFPISSFSWAYLRMSASDSSRIRATADFFNWVLSDGQTFAEQEGYPRLPAPLVATIKTKLKAAR